MIFEGFSGAGGASIGIEQALPDETVIGIEWDADACATRQAAGMLTIRADITSIALEPLVGKVTGAHFSPPCPTFSTAGTQSGNKVIDHLAVGIAANMRGEDGRALVFDEVHQDMIDNTRDEWERKGKQRTEERLQRVAMKRTLEALLVLEPARFVYAIRPAWVTCEQVSAVLPLWEAMARGLERLGYATWAGLLDAADFGVAQNRIRAILMARNDAEVTGPPDPTHASGKTPSIFGLPPWISMADRLGWNTAEEVPLITTRGHSGRVRDEFRADRPARVVTGSAARSTWHRNPTMRLDRRAGHDPPPDRAASDPAPAVTAASGKGQWVWRDGDESDEVVLQTGANSMKHNRNPEDVELYERDPDEPAPTVDGKAGHTWKLVRKATGKKGARSRDTVRDADEPAMTVALGHKASSWVFDRPATVVQGDPRVFAPGGHIGNDGRDNTKMIGRSENAIKVELPELAALQDFPDGFPFQGGRSSVAQQIGNAAPPRFIRHIVAKVTEKR